MPYDIVDAYADIHAVNARLDSLIETLQEKGILPKEKPASKA